MSIDHLNPGDELEHARKLRDVLDVCAGVPKEGGQVAKLRAEISKLGDSPAFPMSGEADVDFDRGMSLRAYIATAALQGLMAHPTASDAKKIVQVAIEIADALIAELAKGAP